jgi:Flp pilus assembly protein TadD
LVNRKLGLTKYHHGEAWDIAKAAQGCAMRVPLIVLAAVVSLSAGGCKSLTDNLPTGSLGKQASVEAQRTPQGWRSLAEEWRPVYEADPTNARAATIYGRALRELQQKQQAVAVLQTAALKNPQNQPLLGEYGRALADVGQFKQALEVLSRAHTPDKPKWRVLMAQGAVLDQMGQSEQARSYYDAALKLQPEDPSILSNLALSHALSNELETAEGLLRRAQANPNATMRVRQNLALVLALQGKYDEAQDVASRDLPPEQSAANIAYIREMMARPAGTKKPGTGTARARAAG